DLARAAGAEGPEHLVGTQSSGDRERHAGPKDAIIAARRQDPAGSRDAGRDSVTTAPRRQPATERAHPLPAGPDRVPRSREDAMAKSRTTAEVGTTRREFLTAAAAVGGPLLVSPKTAFGTTANSRMRPGLIGCGGRGVWIADLFRKHGGYEVRAAADYFPERLEELVAKVPVPADRRYSGLSGYRRVLDAGVDAVAIETPPYFH